MVPLSSVQINEGTDTGVAFVVDRKQVAHKRDVQIGARQQDWIQIRSGIQPGELVITEGSYSLPDGAQVQAGGVQANERGSNQ